MSFDPPGGVNPFEAPRAGIGGRAWGLDVADNDAELIRREHLGREANIKSLGHLNYLGAFFCGLATILIALTAMGVIPPRLDQPNTLDPMTQKLIFGGMAVFYLVFTALYGAMGYGLTHLQVWARWTQVVLTSLGLLYVAFMALAAAMVNPVVGLVVLLFGGGIGGLILYLLVSSKAGVVFSREYQEVIRKTPHVKYKTSIVVKILLGLLLLLIGFGVLAAIFGGGNR
jgi:hypothetical protein